MLDRASFPHGGRWTPFTSEPPHKQMPKSRTARPRPADAFARAVDLSSPEAPTRESGGGRRSLSEHSQPAERERRANDRRPCGGYMIGRGPCGGFMLGSGN